MTDKVTTTLAQIRGCSPCEDGILNRAYALSADMSGATSSTTDGDVEREQRHKSWRAFNSGRDVRHDENGLTHYSFTPQAIDEIRKLCMGVTSTALQSTRKPPVDTIVDCGGDYCCTCCSGNCEHVLAHKKKKALPFDTINIKREALQGVRDALSEISQYSLESGTREYAAQVLASLDAVLSEGE